jgi:predicted Zn-dependent protease with MMP-like domain
MNGATMFRVPREQFETLVGDAVEGLPENLRAQLDNVAIVVQERPSWQDLQSVHRPGRVAPSELFGLYRGVPLPLRGFHYDKVLPDLITIYQAPHEEDCDSLAELREQVWVTVRHEIAHHFGIGDDRLEELGVY